MTLQKEKKKFLSKVNHRFDLKPGVSMETIATILLQKKALLPQKKKIEIVMTFA